MMEKYIIKASGQREPFNIKKFKRSLERAGASHDVITQLAHEIQQHTDLNTTKDIYNYALSKLGSIHRPLAARYNLKNALIEFGPTGFPFEHYVATVFKHQGFIVSLAQLIQGRCVWHEVDLVIQKDRTHAIVECKFHNQQGLKSDVKVSLYVQARFEDVRQAWAKAPDHVQEYHRAWLVTNTKFTTEAIKYGECVGIFLLGWSYPAHNNLAELIDRLGLHPITSLTSLNRKQKALLLEQGFILCRDANSHIKTLEKIGLNSVTIQQVLQEAHGVCSL